MTLGQRCNLVLAFARVLYVNGQATEQTMAAADQLGRTLGLRAKVMPRWENCDSSPRTRTPP